MGNEKTNQGQTKTNSNDSTNLFVCQPHYLYPKVMRVIIFDQLGNVLNKFGCSKHLEFPNGVVVNDRQEIFISDNRAHCVKVFDYEGNFLRQIGGEGKGRTKSDTIHMDAANIFHPVLFVIANLPGITNYPIGVGINGAGEITIADNHNNFNLSVFSQDGQLISALESKVVTSVLNYEYSITNWFKTFLSPWRWLFPIDQYDLCTLT